MSEYLRADSRIYVAGHRGLVGSAITRSLRGAGFDNIVTRTHGELDLTDAGKVMEFLQAERPDCVFLAAAKVGGILANNELPAEFIHQNLVIETNVIHGCWRAGVKRLLFLGSSCIYPRECPQPIKEEYLLTGPLEPTNRPYAVAKIAGIEMCWAYNRQYGTRYLAVMPTNLYGIGDNFDLATSHVLPALIRKMHDAKQARQSEVVVWGSGEPLREFLFSDDLADACITLMGLNDDRIAQLTNPSTLPLVNIGVGKDITIRELAELVREVVGFEGQLSFDRSKPDGTPRKLLDVSRMSSLGWQASTSLRTGIDRVYRWYRAQPGR
jgi:GDP-L-fucose synthase